MKLYSNSAQSHISYLQGIQFHMNLFKSIDMNFAQVWDLINAFNELTGIQIKL